MVDQIGRDPCIISQDRTYDVGCRLHVVASDVVLVTAGVNGYRTLWRNP